VIPDLAKYRDCLSPAQLEQLERAVRRPLPVAIRLNTLKTTLDAALGTWPKWYNWRVQTVAFCDAGWRVQGEDIARTLEHKMGFYYIQDAASMLPVALFDLDGGARPLVLDMAAAPGGKTTHLACKLRDRGLVVANDAVGQRIAPLCDNLRDWGAMNVVVTNYPGERFGSWFPEAFDYVLLDAPCSGESLRTAERRRTRPLSNQDRQALHRQQVALLTSAFQAVRPGGHVVYSTCSLAPEEDEAVLDELLSLYPHHAAVEAVDAVLPIPAPGLESCGRRSFDPQVRRAVRLWPHLYDTAGFFAAKVGKRDSLVSEADRRPPKRALKEAGFKRLVQAEREDVFADFTHVYGFDFKTVVERHGLVLWNHRGMIYAISEAFLSCFADLPCVATGIRVGQRTDGGFVPTHELAARFSAQFTERRLTLSDDHAAMWMGGRDLRGVGTLYPAGTVLLMQDGRGRFLGMGTVQAKRIRNLLPRRLVY
jgi:16S rRNA (cytosine1407-C5)-methyltransferase